MALRGCLGTQEPGLPHHVAMILSLAHTSAIGLQGEIRLFLIVREGMCYFST